MDDILDFGIDILNPLQPESLDFPFFKDKYGDKLILWGGISVQHTMPNGTAEDVRKEVRNAGKILGKGGAFVISPSN
jgi:uroporphyrinogen decarboxylase